MPTDAEMLGVTENVHGALRLLAEARQLLRGIAAVNPDRPLHWSGLHLAQKIADLIGDPLTGQAGTFTPDAPAELEALIAGPRVLLSWPLGIRPDLEDLPTWPDGWPPPAVGDAVTFRAVPGVLVVRAVDWLPEGEGEGDEPFVYVVLRKVG